MFVFCLSLLVNGKWRAFLSQIIWIQHVPQALSLCCWAAGFNHGSSWHTRLARVQVCHHQCDFLLLKTKHEKNDPQKPAVTQESEIPTSLIMTGSLQNTKMTTLDDKKSLIGLSKQVHPKLFEMHRAADTLTQSTQQNPPRSKSWWPGEVYSRAPEMALVASDNWSDLI